MHPQKRSSSTCLKDNWRSVDEWQLLGFVSRQNFVALRNIDIPYSMLINNWNRCQCIMHTSHVESLEQQFLNNLSCFLQCTNTQGNLYIVNSKSSHHIRAIIPLVLSVLWFTFYALYVHKALSAPILSFYQTTDVKQSVMSKLTSLGPCIENAVGL